jgi:hypothetical protein
VLGAWPEHVLGAVSLVSVLVALVVRYRRRPAGGTVERAEEADLQYEHS